MKLRLLCTEFSGRRTKQGYGQVWFESKKVGAHRKAYVQYHNLTLKDIEGKIVRHTCDNPPCINPEHLVLGTHADNMKDRNIRGRAAKGSKHGESKLSNEDVLAIRQSVGITLCELGEKYGVHHSTISRVKNKRNWKHV